MCMCIYIYIRIYNGEFICGILQYIILYETKIVPYYISTMHVYRLQVLLTMKAPGSHASFLLRPPCPGVPRISCSVEKMIQRKIVEDLSKTYGFRPFSPSLYRAFPETTSSAPWNPDCPLALAPLDVCNGHWPRHMGHMGLGSAIDSARHGLHMFSHSLEVS